MGRLTDADAIMEALNIFNDKVNGNEHFLNGIETAKEIIDNAPTIEAEPVRRGRWKMTLRYMPASEISDTASQSFYFAECSVCGWQRRFSEKYKWCPHCGARMDNEVDG